jgi:hypothetical protein
MTKKALFLSGALAAAYLVATGAESSSPGQGKSAAYPPPPGTQEPISAEVCTKTDCTHNVKIARKDDGTCQVVFEPEILYVRGVHNAKVTWTLDASVPPDFKIVTVKFKDQVPKFRDSPAGKRIKVPSGTQFRPPPKIAPDGRSAVTIDLNTTDGAWYYTFQITDGKTHCDRDPPLINGY